MTQLILTAPHPCSYLDDQTATSAFVHPITPIDAPLYDLLLQHGFRRAGEHVYRPHCSACSACTPVRARVNDHVPSRSQRRILKRNQHLQRCIVPSSFTQEHYALYQTYIDSRHDDGDMYPASEEQYRSFILCGWSDTYFMEMRDNGALVGCAVTDRVASGLSAVYTYFDPDYSQASLGTLGVLWQLQLAKEWNLPYLYLGYYIADCQKMNYKTKFRPIESFKEKSWILQK